MYSTDTEMIGTLNRLEQKLDRILDQRLDQAISSYERNGPRAKLEARVEEFAKELVELRERVRRLEEKV